MENKNKSIIISVIIILLIVIIGVTIYFTSKSIIKNDKANNEDETIEERIQDNPDEDNILNVIATPNENEGDSLRNIIATP